MTEKNDDQTLSYETLMAIESIDGLATNLALNHIGQLVDHCDDPKAAPGLTRAEAWCEQLEAKGISDRAKAVLDYFRSNIYGVRQSYVEHDRAASWVWESEVRTKQIFYLRRALNNPAFPKLASLWRVQILTNLANNMNSVGRFVEAQEYWSRALAIDSDFWMALGNQGQGQLFYAKALYDPGTRAVMATTAHQNMSRALGLGRKAPELGPPAALKAFGLDAASIEKAVDVEYVKASTDLDGYPLGRSKAEQSYRQWTLRHRLFLNALNDIGPHSIAARDVLTLPDFVTLLDEPPVYTSYFNQMKQEFVSARWFFYEGRQSASPHFSDRDVLLYNTLDYPTYSLAIERVKSAYRTAYSLFDKMAFFLNAYMKLGIEPTQVSFSRVWRETKKGPVRPQFESSENWPFRGLFWLSKDFFEPELRDITEPDARALHDVRNHLEHKYLKVHEMLIPRQGPAAGLMTDTLVHSITRAEFEAMTLRLLKLARAGLIYLSLGMRREEERRAEARGPGLTASMPLDTWDDKWKM